MSLFDTIGSLDGSFLKQIPVVGGFVSDVDKSNEEKQIQKLASQRPKYTTPDAIDELVQNARAATTAQMPGYTQAKQNIDQSTAANMTNIKNMSSGGGNTLAAMEQANKLNANMLNSLSVQNKQTQQQEKQRYENALRESAKYSDQEFEMNQEAPWEFQMNWAENKYGADQQSEANNQKNTMSLLSNFLGGGGKLSGLMGGGSSGRGGNPNGYSYSTIKPIGINSVGSSPDPFGNMNRDFNLGNQ